MENTPVRAPSSRMSCNCSSFSPIPAACASKHVPTKSSAASCRSQPMSDHKDTNYKQPQSDWEARYPMNPKRSSTRNNTPRVAILPFKWAVSKSILMLWRNWWCITTQRGEQHDAWKEVGHSAESSDTICVLIWKDNLALSNINLRTN